MFLAHRTGPVPTSLLRGDIAVLLFLWCDGCSVNYLLNALAMILKFGAGMLLKKMVLFYKAF